MEKYDFESLIAAGNATGAYRISSGFDVLLYHTFMLIFGGFNLGLILLLAWCFCWRRSYHPNFLIVFFNFFFALFCQALFTGGYSFCLFVVDIVEHPIITWISSIGGIYGTNLLRITYFMFIIERAIATVKHTNYEKDRSIKVGIVLTIISHVVDAFLAFNYFSLGFNMFAQIAILFVFDIFTICSLVFLIAANQRLRRINGRSTIALSQRYQVFENIRALAVAFPIIVAGISINIVGLIATTLQSMYTPVQMMRTPYFYVVITPYVTFILLLIIRKDKVARSRLLNILKYGKVGVQYDSHSNTIVFNQTTTVKNVLGEELLAIDAPDRHFQDLKTMWK